MTHKNVYSVVQIDKRTKLALAIACPTCGAESLQKCTYMQSYQIPNFAKGDIIEEHLHRSRADRYAALREVNA